jgi:hypothetical protein
MTRLQRILIGLLVAQLALAAFVFWPRPNKVSAGKLLLSDIKADEITSLTLLDGSGASIKLTRPAPDQAWVLPDAGDYPADGTRITPVLAKLAAITTDRLVAQTPGSHKQLQVAADAFQRRVELSTAGGATRTLFLGSSAGGQASHVRVDGQNDVYVAADVAPWQLGVDPAAWIDTAYVKVTPADVGGFALANANGQLNFTRDAQGAWQMDGLAAGEQLDTAQVASAVERLAALRMVRPLGKTERADYGLAQPAALATLNVKSGDTIKMVSVAVGAQDATDGAYTVKSSDSPYYVKVAESEVRDLVEKKREGFLAAAPTPAPVSGVSPMP